MAEGVRIRPRPDLNWPEMAMMVVVRDHDRPVPAPRSGAALDDVLPECETCKKAGTTPPKHFVKTYHVQLGGDGSAIVSEGVWDGLQRCADQPFVAVNPVPNPPDQHLLLQPAMIVRP